jgi:transcriptional antiterminator RfaH
MERAHGGRSEAPLFPGYLFLRCEPEDAGRFAFLPGHRVAGWVNFSGVVPAVPDDVIAELRLRVERITRDGGLWRRFKPGETVKVVSGTVETLAQVVSEAKSPEGRVKVLLSFMGRMVEAQVPRQRLWPAQGPSSQPVRLPRRTRGRGRWIHSF